MTRQIKTKEGFVNAFNKKFGNGKELVILRSDDRVILKEGSCIRIKIDGESYDMTIFDYYNEDYKEHYYQLMVLHQVNKWVRDHGWWSEAENAGSLQFLIN